jgi:lipoprotein signal peptidase
LRFGTVTDFIDPGFFAAFNIADSAITVGVILIAISLLIQMLREKR